MAGQIRLTNIGPYGKFKHKDFPTYQSHLSSSSSSSDPQFKHDVFLSFRGRDIRNNFVDHLYTALKRNGINTYKDDEELDRGKDISPELLRAIEESRFSIIVLSRNYADSSWCLDELVHILECMKPRNSVIPIFYHVDPTVIRHQTDSYGEAFAEHYKHPEDEVQRWRFALTSVANLSGWDLKDGRESEFIQNIVEDVSRRLNDTPEELIDTPEELISNPNDTSQDNSMNDKYQLVGMGSRVKKLIFQLDLNTDDVRMIGVWGMPGIGKTTIARVVYEKLIDQFEDYCFLANVREYSQKFGLVALQQNIFSILTGTENFLTNDVHYGIHRLRARFGGRKVLIVLDDVEELNQLEALAGEPQWFGIGSRIIITTRDINLLTSKGVQTVYTCEGLSHNEATQLFILRAIGKKHPATGFEEISNRVIEYANGNPLALKVMGSFLHGRTMDEWESYLARLEHSPEKHIFDTFRISFDSLDEESKDIFLHIACFFNGKKVDRVQQVLDCCGFYSRIGIKVLIDKSLVTISNNSLWMNRLVEEMGRTIVRRECERHCGKRSRLWDHRDINAVIERNLGTVAIKAIVLHLPETDQYWNHRAFSGMDNLELINISSDVHLSQGLDYLPNKLRFFKWRRYPLKSLPPNFYPAELAELNMCHSQLVQLWRGEKIFKNLKFIKLSHSRNLIKTPDFRGVPNLESLVLEGCTNLVEVHPSIGVLKRLRLMNLKDCSSIRSLSSIISTESLEVCILSGCSKLDQLPEVVGNMKCLSQLYLDGVATENLPNSIIERLMRLPLLNRRKCNSFAILLSSIPNIIKLSLRNCDLPEGALPSDIGCLTSLEVLDVGGNNFNSLPASISQLHKLRFLGLANCNLLQSLPELPSSIEYVEARDCSSLMTTVSNPSKVRTSTDLVLSFINCYELKQNHGCKSMIITCLKAYLQSLLNSQNQELSQLSGRFDIIVPGTRIPEWFRHQNLGPSFRIHLPPNWNNNNWIGFVFCVVFRVHDENVDVEHDSQIQESQNSHKITCQLYTNEGSISTGFGFYISRGTYLESDHVWLRYVSTGIFRGRNIRGNIISASFGTESQYLEVKKCGFRAVYKQDVEELGNTELQFICPPTQDLGVHFFSFGT